MLLKRVGSTLVMAISLFSATAQNQVNTQSGQGGTLPVMFDSVRAIVKGDQVLIGWSNLTERDVRFYLIERSKDGKEFKAVYRFNPSSNLNEKAAYSFNDVSPLEGNSYYRISVLIMDGKTIHSRILRAQTGFSTPGFTIYPNPVADERINVSLAAVHKGTYTLLLTNAAGVQIHRAKLVLQGDGITQPFDFPPGLNAGMYVLTVKGETYSSSKAFIKN